eukprot:TRINITY_DN10384_c1_g1_i3.p1 TRINITY_DN10384_c1_g1~~TRINITY_DN10384_c1_g1_i3.p1  ORF type:complete len:506 (-),score=34.94 TRINITY_DN10384_c1_g1_i3:1616-3076(-)
MSEQENYDDEYDITGLIKFSKHPKVVKHIFLVGFNNKKWCLLDRFRLRLANKTVKNHLNEAIGRFIIKDRHVPKLQKIFSELLALKTVDISALRNTHMISTTLKAIEREEKGIQCVKISFKQFKLMTEYDVEILPGVDLELGETLILNQSKIPEDCVVLSKQGRVKWCVDCRINPELSQPARVWLLENRNNIKKVRCCGDDAQNFIANLLRDNDNVQTGEFQEFNSESLDPHLRTIIESLPSSEWIVTNEEEFQLASSIHNASILHLKYYVPKPHELTGMPHLHHVKLDCSKNSNRETQELIVALEECSHLRKLDISFDGQDEIHGLQKLHQLTSLTIRFLSHYMVRPNLESLRDLQIKKLELYHSRGLQIENLDFLSDYPFLELLRIHMDVLHMYRNMEKGIKFDFSSLGPLIWWSFRKLEVVMAKESMEDMGMSEQKAVIEYVSQMIKELISYVDCPYAESLQVDCIDMRTLKQVDISFSIKYV